MEDMAVRPLLLFPIIAVPLLLGSLPALAQGQPSAEQLLQQLRPKGNLINGATRGLRLAPPGSDAPAPAPIAIPSTQPPQRVASNKPAPVPVSPPQQAAPSANLSVNFANGSAELTPEAMQSLDALGQVLASKDLQGFRFRIEGHTDTVGSREYNRELSGRRAEAVIAYVAKTYGVDPRRLQAVGMGEDELLVQTPPQTPEPRNRRVQVINLGT
jgi:outer membrane protein OmpA-like peptidoglycan-associated protein